MIPAACLLLATVAAPPPISWVRTYNSPANHVDEARLLALDSQSNVYVGGFSHSAATLDDYTLLKYSPSGDLLWERHYSGEAGGDDVPSALAVDSQDNIIITGVSRGGPSWGIATIKFDSKGTLLWQKFRLMGQSGFGASPHMALDAIDNIHICGIDGQDYLTIKYMPSGDLAWERIYDGPAHQGDAATDIALDSDGNVIVTGIVDNSNGCMTIKYDSRGTLIWDRLESGDIDSMLGPARVRTDSSGNVIVFGEPETACGLSQYRTWKYNSQGNVQWVRTYSEAACLSAEPAGLAIDVAGNVIVTGAAMVSAGGFRIHTRKYAPNGDLLWSVTHADEQGFPAAVALDVAGNIYITGQSQGGANINYLTLKYEPGGVERWSASFDDPIHQVDQALAVLADDAGGLYITGVAAGDFGTIRYQQPICFADIIPDATVNVADLLAVINSWGPCPVERVGCAGDISPAGTGDGMVNTADLLAVIAAWGPCP